MDKWLVETEVFDNEAAGLIDALESLGVPYKAYRFGVAYEDYLSRLDPNGKTLVYGSLQLIRLARKQPGAVVYCDLPKYECQYYYPFFQDQLVNSRYVMVPMGDLIRQVGWFSDIMESDHLFIKPVGFKDFTGKVFDKNSIGAEIASWPAMYRGNFESLVVVSKPRRIGREWRLVVVNGDVLVSSEYKPARTGEAPREILEYATEVIRESKYEPQPVWVLDICEVEEGDEMVPKVLEVGPFSCCGLYGVDYEKLVRALKGLQ